MAEHCTIISADCHAGGSHEMYREYFDSAYLEDFDAWRAKYRNPSQRPFVQFLLSGVSERFPRLTFVMTEQGCAWIPPMLRRLDATLARIRKTGPYTREHLRQLFHATPPDELQRMLGGNAARVYGFDLEALAPLAERASPTVGELARPLDQTAGPTSRGPSEGSGHFRPLTC
jgi:hypothetical protein